MKITQAGTDLPAPFLSNLKSLNISLDSVVFKEGKCTSYKLHYDKSNQRTLSIKERGFPILASDIIANILLFYREYKVENSD